MDQNVELDPSESLASLAQVAPTHSLRLSLTPSARLPGSARPGPGPGPIQVHPGDDPGTPMNARVSYVITFTCGRVQIISRCLGYDLSTTQLVYETCQERPIWNR